MLIETPKLGTEKGYKAVSIPNRGVSIARRGPLLI